MMKPSLFCMSLIGLFAVTAHAEDPLPPNPFANLPANQAGNLNPFNNEEAAGATPPKLFNGRAGAPAPAANGFGTFKSPANSGAPSIHVTDPSALSKKIDPAKAKEVVENFDYPDAEIIDVAKAISKLTGKNFIYNAQDIKGKISIVSETSITVGDAWNAFLTALNMKNFALIPSGKYLRIDRVVSAKEKQTPIYSDKQAPNNDEFITRVIPLRYIDASEFQQTFSLWIPREARMQAYSQTNTLIITDTAIHINRMMELIALLDIAGYQESLVVIPIKNAAAKDIAKLVEQIITEQKSGSSNSNSYGRPAPTYSFGYNNGGAASTGKNGRGGSTISKIISDDRTNSLIVKANAAGMLEVRTLVRRLDSKISSTQGSGRIHVIRLQFADAEELAKTLSNITGGTGASSAAKTGGATGTTSPFPTYMGAQSAAVFQNEIKVSPDKPTQSLVVTASPQDYESLKKVVESLDIPRDQVFVQAVIMEVSLGRNNNFGTSFVSAANGVALPSASGSLTTILSGNPLIGGFAAGFHSGPARSGFGVTTPSTDTTGQTTTTTQSYQVHSIDGLIELAQANNDANVIATPQIIALDNQEASIEITQEIQVPTTTLTTAGSQTSYTPDTASLLLKVKPQINKASNFVKMDIEQKLENFDNTNVPAGIASQTQGKDSRATKTSAIVQNDDIIALSGLIKDEEHKTTQKIPILGDIPVLGWLFKNTSSTIVKTNLLIFIKPSIIKQYDNMRKVLLSRIEDHNDFIRSELGSLDVDAPSEKEVIKIQKSLPKLSELSPLPEARNMESTDISAPSAPDRDDDGGVNPSPIVPLQPLEVSPPEVGNPQFAPSDNIPPPPVIPDANSGVN